MLSALPAALILLISSDVFALPQTNAGLSMDLMKKRARTPMTEEEVGAWAKHHRDVLIAKYTGGPLQKRSSGTNLIVNQGVDSSFYGSIAVGTPAVSYNVILDTGSSDLWLSANGCTNCDLLPTFNPASSSSFKDLQTQFSINYGVGFASGTLGQDVVQMAGFSVPNQAFGVCDNIAENLLSQPVSGLMGLAFSTIASSGATPFWQSLVSSGVWDSPVMSFQLTRYTNDQNAQDLEPGGTFTMGFVNTTLYTGDIDFQPMPQNPSYWLQSLSSLTVNGAAVTIGSGSDALAAIDTGTTLIGGPEAAIAAIYAQIPNSEPGTGNYEGYYLYPCDTQVTVTVSFGGQTWSINPADFAAQRVSRTKSTCMGAFFVNPTDGSAPAWIFGDTFLKNVYSVYRFNPPAVGFAQLSQYALSLNGAGGPVPEATIGSVVASATAIVGVNRMRNAARSFKPSSFEPWSLVASLCLFLVWSW